MQNRHNYSLGREGEDAACEFLISEGYEIITRNYRCEYGETDIIAQDERYIIFVEVKTRSDTPAQKKHGRPALAVNAARQKRLLNCAHHYMHINRPQRSPRIDVIEILASADNADGEKHDMKIRHIRAAVTENQNY